MDLELVIHFHFLRWSLTFQAYRDFPYLHEHREREEEKMNSAYEYISSAVNYREIPRQLTAAGFKFLGS
jgi:hypothetical protein